MSNNVNEIEFLREEPEEIKEYYIAYFDILGYKQAFCEFGDNKYNIENYLKKIHNSIKENIRDVTSKFTDVLQSLPMNLKVKIFSDNILICLEVLNEYNEFTRLLVFIQMLADIQRDFILKFGLFVRGGIIKGDLSFNNCYVFGKGLIDVVGIENDATYPRIVISKDLIKFIYKNIFSQYNCVLKQIIEILKINGFFYDLDIDDEFINIDNALLFLQKMYNLISFVNKKLYIFKNENYDNILLGFINFEYHFYIIYELSYFDEKDCIFSLSYIYYINWKELLGQEIYNYILSFVEKFVPKNIDELKNGKLLDIPEILEIHNKKIKEQLNKYGEIESEGNKKILKKYLWLSEYHNKICYKYNFLGFLIDN